VAFLQILISVSRPPFHFCKCCVSRIRQLIVKILMAEVHTNNSSDSHTDIALCRIDLPRSASNLINVLFCTGFWSNAKSNQEDAKLATSRHCQVNWNRGTLRIRSFAFLHHFFSVRVRLINYQHGMFQPTQMTSCMFAFSGVTCSFLFEPGAHDKKYVDWQWLL